MTDFTYKPPSGEEYKKALINYLTYKKEEEIKSILLNSTCKILESSQYSRKRWDAYDTEILFEIPVENLGRVNDDMKKKLVKYCDEIMPKDVGFDIKSVDFRPIFGYEEKQSLILDIEKTQNIFTDKLILEILNPELISKGKDMAKAYLYLYCIENSIRSFIDKRLVEKFGDDYITHLSEGIRNKITERKKEESLNKWISVRGASNVFYLDFKELGSVIIANWDLFVKYFPDQEWIRTKIDDMSKVRNLIAHNSSITDAELKLIGVYFEVILKQIEQNNK